MHDAPRPAAAPARRRRGGRTPLRLAAMALAAVAVLAACGEEQADETVSARVGVTSPPQTSPVVENYETTLTPLNGSGAQGRARYVRRDETLEFTVSAEGLEPGRPHPVRLHEPVAQGAATCPVTDLADADGDGLVSAEEARRSYGPAVVDVEPVPTGSEIDVTTQVIPEEPSEPLIDAVLVIHGVTFEGTYYPEAPAACGPVRGTGEPAEPIEPGGG